MEKDAKILITGGSGLLGIALKKILPDALYPTHEEFDITKNWTALSGYLAKRNVLTVFHGAAFTSPPKIDKSPIHAVNTNILGTTHITLACMYFNIKLIYMSTDYIFEGGNDYKFVDSYNENDPFYPVNKYAWSKLGGECAVRLHDNSVIIRGSFGPDIFPYDKAFTDQYTSRISVTEMAKRIVNVMKTDYTGTIHIGNKGQSVYDFARKTKPDVGKMKRSDVDFDVPCNTSLNTRRYDKLMKQKGPNNE